MLNRLQDRLKEGTEDVMIRGWGMWGTMCEIWCIDGKYRVIHPNGDFEVFRLLRDAETRLKELKEAGE